MIGQSVVGLEYFVLDVFTTERFGGNPLAVVNEADQLTGDQMQQIAAEFNLSETVFILRPQDRQNTACLRIFTPARELPFAGHPTVGTAILLAELGADFSRDIHKTIRFEEQIGLIVVEVSKLVGEPTYGEFAAAKMPKRVMTVPDNEQVAAALGIAAKDIGFGLHKVTVFDAGNAPLFVPLTSRQVLAETSPNSQNWAALEGAGAFGVYPYCRGANGCEEFHVRLFAPEAGIIEDPATGSAAVAFAGALNEALMLEDGAHRWLIHQGEDMGRPSRIDLKAEVAGGQVVSVKVGGHGVRVARGVISV